MYVLYFGSRTRSILSWFAGTNYYAYQIDVVLYYAPILFRQAGFTSEKASFLSSGVTGIVMLACTIPAQIWIDRWGRRMPLIIGGFIMSTCFIVTGSLYARFGQIENDEVSISSKAAQWVVIVLIYIFVANFSWSWAVVRHRLLLNPFLWLIPQHAKVNIGWQDIRLGDHSYQTASESLRFGAGRKLDHELRCHFDGATISTILA